MGEVKTIENVRKPKRNLAGERFGKLTVISLTSNDKYTIWHCKCDCGAEKDFYQHNLTNGKATSCGCLRKMISKKKGKENLHVYKGIQIEKAKAKTTQKNNTTGFRGVFLDKKTGKYRARIIMQGIRHELGWYHDFEEAKKARIAAEEKRDAIVEEYIQLQKLALGGDI